MVTDGLSINISANTGNTAQNINNAANALTALDDKAKSASTDMSGLVNDMTAAASSMVSISQNISASAAGLGGFRSNIEAVNAALQGVNIRFDTLNSSIQASYSAFDGAAASISSLSAASEASAAGLGSVVAATDGFADKMGDLRAATTGTTDGMSDLQRELRDTLTSLRGFSDNVTAAGQDAKDAADKINDLVGKVNAIPSGGNVLGLAAGFRSLKGIIATLGVGKFIKDSNDAYNVQMQNELKLTSHMKHRMNATDEEIKSVKELASAQQKLGVIGDEIQLAGAQQLTTYARESSTLKTLIPAMNNLIAQNAGYEASVGDATSAADMLGHALTGQYTSLRRAGVVFSEAQEQVLKYGTESQKAAVIADAVNSKVGNMNALLRSTPTGELKSLQNDFGDLEEQIGATFQPLITAVVPIASEVMHIIAPIIADVSRGISTIGSAIAQLDSPAVRAIGLTAAGIAVLSKLKTAIGGPLTLLIALGSVLAGLIGRASEHTDDIGKAISNAYNDATDATNEATGAAYDYNEELGNVEKTAKRLAGFDTITKLSGNSSSGALVKALLGDNGLDELYKASDAASDLQKEFNSMEVPNLNIGGFDIMELLFGKDFAANWLTGWNALLTWWNNTFLPNWTTGCTVLKNAWDKFWKNWETGMNYLFDTENGNGLTKDVGNLLKAAPEGTFLHDQGVLMADYGARTKDQLLNKDLNQYADYMQSTYGVPLPDTESLKQSLNEVIGYSEKLDQNLSSDGTKKLEEFQARYGFVAKDLLKSDNLLIDYKATNQTYESIACQPVSQKHETSYTDIPLKPVGVPSSVMEKATVVNFNVDGETITSLVVKDGEVEKYNGKGVG